MQSSDAPKFLESASEVGSGIVWLLLAIRETGKVKADIKQETYLLRVCIDLYSQIVSEDRERDLLVC